MVPLAEGGEPLSVEGAVPGFGDASVADDDDDGTSMFRLFERCSGVFRRMILNVGAEPLLLVSGGTKSRMRRAGLRWRGRWE